MNRSFIIISFFLVVVYSALAAGTYPPLALHPDNPHYFLFRGEPAILVTSGEHYGAVLNADFDYVRYLDTLQSHGFNLTRIFCGAYVETENFGIAGNTLVPAPGRFLAPWGRSQEPGYAGGGNKFDLTTFDETYFARLREFMTEASHRGIIVEVNLFCPYYGDSQWNVSPLNHANNVNGLGHIGRTDALTLDRHAGLLTIEEAMVRRIVDELRDFDNLYYEVCNEPYERAVPLDWQHHMAGVIVAAELEYPSRHLISFNVNKAVPKITQPHPDVSIYNFHYASPPDVVSLNYSLDKVIGDNETGGRGVIADRPYRTEGWEFLLAGGGLYNNLDFSFTVGHEDGSFINPPTQVGGGSPALRRQLEILKEFVESFDFIRMRPDASIIRGGVPAEGRAHVLAEPGKAYAVYLTSGPRAELELALPAGRYRAKWLNPLTGEIDKSEDVDHHGEIARLVSPDYSEDMSLSLRLIQ